MMTTGPITNRKYDISGNSEKHQEHRREYWSEVAQYSIPKGSVVESVEYNIHNDDSLVISLRKPDGTVIHLFPMRDDEGNGPGAVHTITPHESCDPDDADYQILPTLS